EGKVSRVTHPKSPGHFLINHISDLIYQGSINRSGILPHTLGIPYPEYLFHVKPVVTFIIHRVNFESVFRKYFENPDIDRFLSNLMSEVEIVPVRLVITQG